MWEVVVLIGAYPPIASAFSSSSISFFEGVLVGSTAAAGDSSCCESAGEGTAVGSLLDTGSDLLVVAVRMVFLGFKVASFASTGASGPDVVTSISGKVCSCAMVPFSGARYCCLKLLADVEGHAPCSERCGLSASSWEAMVVVVVVGVGVGESDCIANDRY